MNGLNALDAVILLVAAMAVVGGYRLGFLARAASWVGLGLGLYFAARFLPGIVESFRTSSPATNLMVAAGVLVLGAMIGQSIGLIVGTRVGRILPLGPFRMVDRVVGAAVGLLGVSVAVWLLLPSMADVPGWPSRQARNSAIARAIDSIAPPPPDTLQALRRLVGEQRFPRVFEALRPSIDTGPPPTQTGLPEPVLRRVVASTVKVEGVACRRVQEGSGFAVGREVVVTNAHVVAGQRETRVVRPDGRELPARVTVFDPNRDLALLRVAGLNQVPLPVGEGEVGDQGAVFGHPDGQEAVRVAPAAVRQVVNALGRDLYDSRQIRRGVLILAADLRPGDSGGALVDRAGAVIGVAFAIAPDRPGTSYALTSEELGAVLAAPRAPEADTGQCLTAT